MPNPTHPEGVPLDVWLCNQDTPPTGYAVRRHLAGRLIDVYSAPDGIVVDLAPGGGEAVAPATATGRSGVVHLPASLCAGRRLPRSLAAIAGTADLVLVLPPASRLAPARPHAPSALAARALARRAAPLLRPGGFLVLGMVSGRPGADPLAGAVEAADKAGLAYFQHIVALIARGLDFAADDAADGTRRLAHADLLVFARRAA